MSNKHNLEASYSLEHRLAQSIEKVTDNITRQHKLRREIIKLRRERRQLEKVPDEVKEWFEETEESEEEDEE
jgi:hypothetical protein